MTHGLEEVGNTQGHAHVRTRTSWLQRYHWAIALLAYTVLTLLFTYPLIFHPGDRVIGPVAKGDDDWYIWYLWLFRRTLLKRAQCGGDELLPDLVGAAEHIVRLNAAITL